MYKETFLMFYFIFIFCVQVRLFQLFAPVLYTTFSIPLCYIPVLGVSGSI